MSVIIAPNISVFLNLRQFESVYKKLSNLFEFAENINVFMCESQKELAFKIETDFIPSWVIAANHGGNVFILDPNFWNRKEDINQICIHELTHVIINKTISNCPLWLNEALAMFYANQIICYNVSKTINPYDTDYDSGMYENSSRVFQILIEKHGECFIINRIKNQVNIYNDEILGYEALSKLIAER